MSERRKIVIQTGSDADEPLSTPHFDTEATLTARPVVPLAEGGHAFAPLRAGKSWNPLLLVLIILGAISLGVATGLAIGFYRSRQTATPAVASESPVPATEDIGTQKPTPTPQAQASVPEPVEEPPVQPAEDEEKPDRPARDERDDDASAKDKDNEKATPPVVRENKRPDTDDEAVYTDDLEARRAERQRRREERRERRRQRQREQDEETISLPREVERAGREINRIRDIFEGRQP